MEVLLEDGVRTVLDLGCGSGALVRRLAVEDQFTAIIGMDTSGEALLRAAESVAASMHGDPPRISLLHESYTDAPDGLDGFDAATLIETIEHIEPAELSKMEHSVFMRMRPGMVVISTPNRDYNVLYGIGAEDTRHPDHRFEWDRSRFGSWARGVANRTGYRVTIGGIGPRDPLLGSPTQMAVFRAAG